MLFIIYLTKYYYIINYIKISIKLKYKYQRQNMTNKNNYKTMICIKYIFGTQSERSNYAKKKYSMSN